MAYNFFIWTPDIIEHLAEHDVTPEEFEEVVIKSGARRHQPIDRQPGGIRCNLDGSVPLLCLQED